MFHKPLDFLAIGDITTDAFIRLKEAEWQEYNTQVTRWEVNRYLTMF